MKSFFAYFFQEIKGDPTSAKAASGFGGWLTLTYKPIDKLEFNVGGGIDSVRASTIPTGARSKNATTYMNGQFYLNKFTKVGLEYQYYMTQYVGIQPGNTAELSRIQATCLLLF